MNIYKSAVNKPITTLMIFTAIIVMGVYSLMHLPVDLYPEMDPPYISVMTSYSGAGASDIEANITRPLEDLLNSVDNLKQITSKSSDNLSLINLEFEWETDLSEAANDIRDSIDIAMNFLPEGVDRPTIFKFNLSMFPVVFFAVTAKESYPGLEKIIDERIINPLNRIDGVGSVSLAGAPARKIYVEIDPYRLDAYHLTLEAVGAVISGENLNMPSGNIKMGNLNYPLRITGELDDSAQLNHLVVGHYNSKAVYLKDVATVRDTIKDVVLEERINGGQGARMFVMKQSGANTVQVAREVKRQLETLKKDLPPDIQIMEIIDTSTFINQSVQNLSQTMIWALIFVVLTVLFFLGRWRATFIIVLTIPISLIMSFIYLFTSANTINVISLASLSIALGMVVDDAIVVLENITKHIERGTNPREAAIYATNEVWLAVIITTLVIVAVFFPLTLVPGMTGVLFRQLGWIVTITVVTSTLAAISLTPMLASQLLRLKLAKRKPWLLSYDRTIRVFLDKLDAFYEWIIRRSLRHRKKLLVFFLCIFIASLQLRHSIGTEFLPQTDESRLSVTVELQTGLRVEKTLEVTSRLEQLLKDQFPEVLIMSSSSGADDEGNFTSLFFEAGSNMINMTAKLVPVSERSRSVWEIAEALRPELTRFPEIVHSKVSTNEGGPGFGGNTNQVDVEIYGYDFKVTNRLAQEIQKRIASISGAADVRISRKDDRPELQITFDREKLALHGLNTAMVSSFVKNRVGGQLASLYREEGEEYDIIVRFAEAYRQSISDLENYTITNPMGQQVKLGELAQVQEYWSPPNIERKRRERIVTVSAVPVGIPLGQLAAKIKTQVDQVDIPDEILINIGGAYEDQVESFKDLGLLLVISFILVFLVMASQFESFVMPFIIMFSIPFSFTGVILSLYLTHTTLGVIAALGAVLLVGIVVKNGIVLVDYINLMRDRGHELYEAIAMAGRSRLRPVLMTALTTMLAMLPLALSKGEGAEIWSPMGITLIGGLIFSTLVTLIVVPLAYAVFARKGQRDKQLKVRKKFVFMNNND